MSERPLPNFTAPMRGAIHLDFDLRRRQLLYEQWKSEKVTWPLRALCLMAATIFHEQGAPTLRITKLLGNDELELEAVTPFSAGLAAEVSLYDLPMVSGMKARSGIENATVTFIANRINMLFYFGPGRKEAAQYGDRFGVYDRMILQVPTTGFEGQTLSLWHEFGNVGTIQSPRKRLLVNE